MSNLDSLRSANGNIAVAEATEFEHMNTTDMANLLTIALEDAAIEAVSESLGAEDANVLFEGVIPADVEVMETSIIKLDKKAKKQRAYKLAILQCAKDDDNKDYKKLETLWKMEKFLFRKLEKRYASKARSRMMQTAKKASEKNNVFKKAKNALTRSQRETKQALAGNIKPPTQIKTQFNQIEQKLGSKIK